MQDTPRRTSHEVRGLKYSRSVRDVVGETSHLTRGAWIEIGDSGFTGSHKRRTSHEVRGLK